MLSERLAPPAPGSLLSRGRASDPEHEDRRPGEQGTAGRKRLLGLLRAPSWDCALTKKRTTESSTHDAARPRTISAIRLASAARERGGLNVGWRGWSSRCLRPRPGTPAGKRRSLTVRRDL